MSERITFQEFTSTTDANNQLVKTWANISTVPTMWAKAIPRTSKEDFQVQKGGFQRYDFKVLHRTDLNIKMRISWDGRYWDIKGIEMFHKADRNKELLITTEWRDGQYD